MSRALVMSVAGLVLFAGVLGYLTGLRYVPPGETEIILRAASAYEAETGRDVTECFARPSELEGVRLVVICGPATDDANAWARAFDQWSRDVTDAVVQIPGAPAT